MQRLLHKRLAKSLLLEISRGNYVEEGQFLSNRNIQKLWGVSQRTTDRSLNYLKEEQIIVPHNRSAYQLAPGARERAMFLSRYCDDKPLPKVFQGKTKSKKLANVLRQRCALIIEYDRCWATWRADLDKLAVESLPLPLLSRAVPDVCEGFLDGARELGHQADIILIHKDENCRSFLQACIKKVHWNGVAFIRWTANTHYREAMQCIKEASIPQITILEPSGDSHVPCVEVNNFALGYEAAMAMIQTGVERFIILDIIAETYSRNARIKGALFALRSKGLEERCILNRMSHLPENPIEEDFERLLIKSKTTPTGVFVLYNQLMDKIGPLIDRNGLQIPEQISIINCSTPIKLPNQDRELPFVEVNFREIGKTAYHSLSNLLDGHLMKKYTIIEPTLRNGSTNSQAERTDPC